MAQAKAKGTEWRGGIRDGQGGKELLFEESYGGCKAVFNVMDEGGKGTTEIEFGLLASTYSHLHLLVIVQICKKKSKDRLRDPML